jgi:hypothetical protein
MKNINHDINLAIQTGGYIAFEKTQSFPRYLVFNSPELRRSWRLILIKNEQNGVLKVNGQIAFHYFFDGLDCKMQSVDSGIITSEWELEEIMMVKRD